MGELNYKVGQKYFWHHTHNGKYSGKAILVITKVTKQRIHYKYIEADGFPNLLEDGGFESSVSIFIGLGTECLLLTELMEQLI